MKKSLAIPVALVAFAALTLSSRADMKGGKIDPAAEFKEHCAVCHVNGGNIVNPAKTLKKADLDKNGVKGWQDIVAKMRNPGPGMTKFEEKDIPDPEAKAIAEFILETFK